MKKVLINWYYHRFDLTEYLLSFNNDMEIVFLFKQFPAEEPEYVTDKKNISIIYWGDYTSPQKILEKVQPDVVVFADLESFNQIALNIAARNKGIRTFVLQHGSRGAFEVEEAINLSEEKSASLNFSNTTSWSLKFLLNSLSWKNLKDLPKLIRFLYARKTGELTAALYKHKFELRRADFYIEFSEENIGYHKLRDGVPDDRFIITGNPLFDNYFEYFNKPATGNINAPYCLVIDCPFTEANFIEAHGITATQKNEFLKILSRVALNNGFQLNVKLHPLSYNTPGLYEDENINYEKDCDLKKLIKGATYVFFFHFSTLTPVILAYKPSIYFHSVFHHHRKIFSQLNIPTVDLLDNKEHSLQLETTAKKTDFNNLVPFLYSTDGKASERIKTALLNK